MTKITDIIVRYGNKIRNNKFESVIVLNKNNDVFFRTRGAKEYLKVDDVRIFVLKIEPETIMIHNHPSGATFGYDDISTALTSNSRAFAVVTSDATHILTPRSGKTFSIGPLNIKAYEIQRRDDLIKRIKVRANAKMKKYAYKHIKQWKRDEPANSPYNRAIQFKQWSDVHEEVYRDLSKGGVFKYQKIKHRL